MALNWNRRVAGMLPRAMVVGSWACAAASIVWSAEAGGDSLERERPSGVAACTREILGAVGYADAAIDELIASGAVVSASAAPPA